MSALLLLLQWDGRYRGAAAGVAGLHKTCMFFCTTRNVGNQMHSCPAVGVGVLFHCLYTAK